MISVIFRNAYTFRTLRVLIDIEGDFLISQHLVTFAHNKDNHLMAKLEKLTKQNPKLIHKELQDGRASLLLEYYLGRKQTPVLDDEGNPVFYTSGNQEQ